MEKLIKVKEEFNSLDKIENFLKKESSYQVSQDYDRWEIRADENGHMKKCVVVQKSNLYGLKLFLTNESTVKATYIIPNKIMESYFGKKAGFRSIFKVITEKIKDAILSGKQQKAFDEMIVEIEKMSI